MKRGAARPEKAAPSLWAGLIAAGVGLAVGELAAALLPRAKSPLEATGHALIDVTPGPFVDFGVALLQDQDKPVIRTVVTGAALSLGVLAARLEAKRGANAVFLAGGALGALAGATRVDAATSTTALASLAGGVAGATTLRILTASERGRKAKLTAGATIVSASLLTAALHAQRWHKAQEQRAQIRLPVSALPDTDLSSLTPVGEHYVIDVKLSKPHIHLKRWRLRVTGLVERDLSLTYADLLALPLETQSVTLRCVHDPPGGHRVGTSAWLGVPVSALLERAGVSPAATSVVARSVDGYEARVPLGVLRERRALVALGMNGAPLTPAHGFPARLLTPSIYGFDGNTKWLTELEVATDNARSWGEKRGWPAAPAVIQTGSRIDTPKQLEKRTEGNVEVAGVAWSLPDGVVNVEVSVDGGPWRTAELAEELAPTAWRRWRYLWHAKAGQHTLRVRALGREKAQVETVSGAYPDGPTGVHTVRVQVVTRGSPTRPTLADDARRFLGVASFRVRLAARWLWAWRE